MKKKKKSLPLIYPVCFTTQSMWLAEITNAVTELIKKRNPSWIFPLKYDILNTCIDKKMHRLFPVTTRFRNSLFW